MKSLLCIMGTIGFFVVGCDPKPVSTAALAEPTAVDAACGRCQFKNMERKGCDLAVRIDGKVYFVEGFKMRDFGNPDLEGGMCNAIRQAKIAGAVTNNLFAATSFELLPLENK